MIHLGQREQLEVDFVCNRGPERIYVQSAYALPDREKVEQEQASLLQIKDGFRKAIIADDRYLSGYDENDIRIPSLKNFLNFITREYSGGCRGSAFWLSKSSKILSVRYPHDLASHSTP